MQVAEQLYDVRDIYFAAFCMARGLELKGYYAADNGWLNFQFDALPVYPLLKEWNSPTPSVNAREFVNAEKYLRGLLNSR